MRKALLIIAIVILALTPVAAYAIMTYSPARSEQGFRDERQELTQQQQADLQESHQKMIELRKETITKMVQNGLLTTEEGQKALEQLDNMAADRAANGYAFGSGRMSGCRGGFGAGNGNYGRGMMRGYDWD